MAPITRATTRATQEAESASQEANKSKIDWSTILPNELQEIIIKNAIGSTIDPENISGPTTNKHLRHLFIRTYTATPIATIKSDFDAAVIFPWVAKLGCPALSHLRQIVVQPLIEISEDGRSGYSIFDAEMDDENAVLITVPCQVAAGSFRHLICLKPVVRVILAVDLRVRPVTSATYLTLCEPLNAFVPFVTGASTWEGIRREIEAVAAEVFGEAVEEDGVCGCDGYSDGSIADDQDGEV